MDIEEIKKIEGTVESITLPVINSLGYQLVDVEFVNEEEEWYLRIYIDNDQKITIDDCTKVSRAIDEIIDEADPVPIGYYLEVSSPGPNRKIKSDSDFIKFIGSSIKINLHKAVNGQNEIEGILDQISANEISIKCNGDILGIDRKNIKEARLNDL